MERREFLKLFGFGAAAMGAVALTMSPAAASAVTTGSAQPPLSADDLLKQMAATDSADGEFAQYRRHHRRRHRMCRRVRTRHGWRTVCR